jgi:molecular chaperone DnaK
MMRDAELHAEEDKKRRELVEARNQADGLAYSVEKTLKENSEKVPAADATRIQSSIEALRRATGGEDVETIRKAMDDLQRSSHAMAEALYRQAQAGPSGAPGAGPTGGAPGGEAPGGGGDVIDAEVVDDGKK